MNQETFELTSWETCEGCLRLSHVQTAVQINFVGPKNLARVSSRFPTHRRNPLFRVKRRGKYFLFLSSLLNGDGDCQLSLERRGRKRTYFPDFFSSFLSLGEVTWEKKYRESCQLPLKRGEKSLLLLLLYFCVRTVLATSAYGTNLRKKPATLTFLQNSLS